MTVTKMTSEMTMTEYQGWSMYFAEKERKESASNGNLLAMDTEEILSKFGGSDGR